MQRINLISVVEEDFYASQRLNAKKEGEGVKNSQNFADVIYGWSSKVQEGKQALVFTGSGRDPREEIHLHAGKGRPMMPRTDERASERAREAFAPLLKGGPAVCIGNDPKTQRMTPTILHATRRVPSVPKCWY